MKKSITAAFRSEGSLRNGVSRIGNSVADIDRSQPQIAFSLGERPEAVVGIVVPLPFQREVRAVIIVLARWGVSTDRRRPLPSACGASVIIVLARFLGRVGKVVIGSHYL